MLLTTAALETETWVIELENRLRQAATAVGEGSGDDYLLLDLESGDYFGLGTSGGFVWEHLNGELTLGEIAQLLADHYHIGLHAAEADVVHFVTQLLDRDLVVDTT